MQKIGWSHRFLSKHRLLVAGVFALAAIAHVPYLAPGGPTACHPKPAFLSIDEGTVLYDSFRITCGEVIYRDFFEFQGPVFYYFYAGLFAITGPSLGAARALNLFLTALTATFIALLVARSLGTLAGAGIAAVHACLLVPMYPYAYPHWLAEVLAFAGIYLLATSDFSPRRELAAGACFGLSAATIQSLGLPILAACMVALFVPGIAQYNWRETFARPLRLLGGALLSISPFIIHLGIVGALDQMWYAMVVWIPNHYSEGQRDALTQGYAAYLNTYLTMHRSVGQPWRILAMFGLVFIKLLPFFAIFGVIVTTVHIIVDRWRRSVDFISFMIGTAAIAAIAPLFFGITRGDIVHIAFVGSFGLCGAAIALQPLVARKPRFRLPVAIVWVFVAILIIINFSAKTVMTYRLSREMEGWRGEILKLGIASWIDSNLGPNERIVTAAYGGLQYLYIRRAAVSFTFLPFNTPKYYSDEQWQKLGGEIFMTLPPVIEVTKEQWLQVTQRTPGLNNFYQLVDNHFLLRKGFIPHK